MEGHLSLIKNEFVYMEKRVLPKFPFCYLTFRTGGDNDRTFEVCEISHSGMQLSLKVGGHRFKKGDMVEGTIHRPGGEVSIQGAVKWTTFNRMGVRFKKSEVSDLLSKNIKTFLSVNNLVALLKPLHNNGLDLDLPLGLKCWLRADGPVELFTWQSKGHEFSLIQLIILEHFIEWEDGKGAMTGRVITKRDLETPLVTEDEFLFDIDSECSEKRLALAQDLIKSIPPNILEKSIRDFILLKLR